MNSPSFAKSVERDAKKKWQKNGRAESGGEKRVENVIHRPTQTPLCGFTVAERKALKFSSDEHVWAISFLYDIILGGL